MGHGEVIIVIEAAITQGEADSITPETSRKRQPDPNAMGRTEREIKSGWTRRRRLKSTGFNPL